MREFRGYAEFPVAGLVRDPGKQQACELLRRTAGEQQFVHIVERGLDLAGEHGGARQRGVAVVFDQTQEAVAFDELDLAKLDGGHRNRRWPPGDDRAQPEHLAVSGNFQDDRLAIAGLDRKLGTAGTGDVDAAGDLTFRQQSGVTGIQGQVPHRVELGHQRLRQIAEVAGPPQSAA